MMALGLLIAVVPPLFAGASWGTWAYNGLVVLVIACPCALVISTPVSIVSALTSAAHNGVLIKGGRYLEAAGSLECVALDKTGTLTRGAPVVHEVVPLAQRPPADILRLAASLERHSNHPLARAIVRKADEQEIELFETSANRSLTGLGVEAVVAGEQWWIGSDRLVAGRGLMNPTVEEAASRMEDAGRTVVAVGNQTEVVGLIALADELRAGAREAVDAMRWAGVKHIAMLTGDNRRTAERIASQAGVDHCSPELLPEDKVREIERLHRQFEGTAMVGDGINDAPALASATVGIAMGAVGSDAAIETADIALMADDLRKVPWLINHARRTVSIIKQNITFALGLKLLFVALTLAGMASLWLAIAADTGASLLVIFNGLRLLRRA
jgi:Cd2+/Zn2+-exporting ATPase